MKSPYDVLDVDRDATDTEIDTAYRNQARKHHPDLGGESKSFKEVALAYDILSNSDRRKNYDETGKDSGTSGRAPMSKLQAYIASMLVDAFSDENKKPIEVMILATAEKKREIQKQVNALSKTLLKIKKRRDQFSHRNDMSNNGDSVSFILEVLDESIVSMQSAIDGGNVEVLFFEEAIKFLGGLEDLDVELIRNPNDFGWAVSGGTSPFQMRWQS